MNGLLKLLQGHEAVQAVTKRGKTIICSETTDEALLLASAFPLLLDSLIIVKQNLFAAQRLYERMQAFLGDEECLFFPADESLRVEALASSPELLVQRVYVLSKMRQSKPLVIITHTAALIRLLTPVSLFDQSKRTFKVNQIVSREDFIRWLTSVGYERVGKVEHSLQYAVRGGVVDVFSVFENYPIRFEFFGDEIDSIRLFDLESQRTKEQRSEVDVSVASDLLMSEEADQELAKWYEYENKDSPGASWFDVAKENTYSYRYKYYAKFMKDASSLLDYSPSARVVISNFTSIKENYQMMRKEQFDYLNEINEAHLMLHFDLNELLPPLNHPLTLLQEFRTSEKEILFPLRGVEPSLGNAKRLRQIINDYLDQGNKVVLCVENKHQADSIHDYCKEWEMDLHYCSIHDLPTQTLSYMELALQEGFELLEHHLVFISAKELFGRSTKQVQAVTRYRDGMSLKSYDNLHPGDYIVHEQHGIGQFIGIVTMEMDGIHRDYLHIAYRGKDVLYVPLEQFRLVRKYVSKEGIVPHLNKLGTDDWQKTKKRIKHRISDIADRLMLLYADRTKTPGYAFSKDDEWQVMFENSFPYELTDDQKRSVQEIKEDMERPYPMDRLLCGDVGFGKTEVAFIAAFKAIMNGKQVALLCPTTLLAKQHFETALARFQNFPIQIGLLSRFVSDAKQREYLEKTKEGSIHLLIGTHRLLSKDIKFKDLGLLIVDEEQRFGVEHKEKIKELKKTIDVLTLSATPIPRTLQMALIGIRSLSQIDTPPSHRMPVQTYVIEKNKRLIKEIIERELGRHGQVYYLHNKIDSIYSIAEEIKASIPGANVIVIHGQMQRDLVEESMELFNRGEANVMVCTTIIENGIDISNANTIIVDDADNFGLSQLYQIKGRVGRSDRLAYAYLMYRARKQLSEIAIKRLRAIKEFAELGSGYRIAMRDLSIRGAGDILGAEQAGFIDTVGMEMYLQLLHEAIEERKTGIPTPELVVSKPLPIDAYIPQQFTNDDLDKIDLYKKIDEVKDFAQLSSLTIMMEDLYGKLPVSVALLLEKRRFELTLESSLVEEVKDTPYLYEIIFSELLSSYQGIGVDLFRISGEISPLIQLTFRQGKIRAKISKKDPNWLLMTNKFLQKTIALAKKFD